MNLQEQLDSITFANGSMMRCDQEDASNESEDASNESEDARPSESSNEINSVDLQNQIDGRGNAEEVNLIEEAAGVKIGMEETPESSVDEGVKAAQVLATKDEDEKSSEVLQNNETSIAKEHHEATIVHGQASELSSLLDESSDRATDTAPDDHDVVQGELAELPQGVGDDLDHSAVEADSSISDHSKHLKEALIGEPHHETGNEENHQTMEAHEASNLPLNGAELETEETEIGGSLDSKFEEEEYTPQQLENLTADLIEPSEASAKGELPTAEACVTNDKSLENSGSMMEEEPLEEGDLEKTSPINDAVNMDEVERAVEAESNDATDACIAKQTADVGINHSVGGDSEESRPEITEACHPGGAEHEEDNTDKATIQWSPGEDDIRERNRRLMEENERLREMMEKLIKSGQEQLTAISSLSGRVKDMEKRLSRKKKPKVKQYKAPKSSNFDGEKKTIDVTM